MNMQSAGTQHQQQQGAAPSTVHHDPNVAHVRDVFFNFLGRYFEAYWLRDGVDPELRGEWFNDPGEYYRDGMLRLLRTQSDDDFEMGSDVARRTLCVSYKHFQEYAPTEADWLRLQFPRYRAALSESVYRVLTDILSAEPKECHPLYYSVAFFDVPGTVTVRGLRSSQSGVLCTLRATVTRMTQVRPELVQACFSCQNCGAVSDPIPQYYTYTTPLLCKQEGCGNRELWQVVHNKHTVVSDWQKVKAQEDSEALLPGSTPRGIDVILRGDFVERALPGDKASFIGFVSVVPEVGKMFGQQDRRELTRANDDSARATGGGDGGGVSRAGATNTDGVEGLKSLGSRILAYKLCFVAIAVADRNGNVRTHSDVHSADKGSRPRVLTTHQEAVVSKIASMPNFFDALIRCVAPNVFAYKLVKLGLLLQLAGGVHKVTLDGSSLRGDINVLLVGDPAVAKSHFLKWVSKVAPRGVYTNGKTSTAAGLTASVARDIDTGEYTIEAGALMLADNGLCCIDEFEKMDPQDMVAIHEAMEQQTISIAKAGIKATLKARAAILAAANPISGVYDISKPLHQNVQMTQPIMSRFDLIFILADTSNTNDRVLAERLTELHRSGEAATDHLISCADFLTFLDYTRMVEPKLTEEACTILATSFRDLRTEKTRTVTHRMFRYTTRQLESMIRLSEAVARLHLDTEVRPAHVHTALTLMRASMTHTELIGDANDEVETMQTPAVVDDDDDINGAAADDDAATNAELRTLLVGYICESSPSTAHTLHGMADWLLVAAPVAAQRVSSEALVSVVKATVTEMLRTGIITRGPDASGDAVASEVLETDRFFRGGAIE